MTSRPSLLARLAVAAFRNIPPIRGRGRLEILFHRLLEERGLRDVVTVNGYTLEVSLDDLIGRTIYLNGGWEPANTLAVIHLIRKGATVFDVGANTGYFTLLFSAIAGEVGQVFAFEPVPSTAEVLRRNLASNPRTAQNVTVLEVALSDREGVVRINVAGDRNLGASHVVAAPVDDLGRERAGVIGTILIPCSTADAVWRRLGRPAVDLVKIDIEGHEYHALRGMREVIAASPTISIMVEVRESFLAAAGSSSEQLFADLRDVGMHAFDFNPVSGLFARNEAIRAGELIIFSKRALDQ